MTETNLVIHYNDQQDERGDFLGRPVPNPNLITDAESKALRDYDRIVGMPHSSIVYDITLYDRTGSGPMELRITEHGAFGTFTRKEWRTP